MLTEQATKGLLDAVRFVHGDRLRELHALKRDGVVTIALERAFKVEVKADETCSIMWIQEIVDRLNLNKDAISNKLKTAMASAGVNLPWCP